MTIAPAPALVQPSTPLLDLCTYLVEAAVDLSQQAAAPHDRDEALGKITAIQREVHRARLRYLSALGGVL